MLFPVHQMRHLTPDPMTDAIVKDREARKAFMAAGHACPACCETRLLALGGRGSCWLECPCGAYSPMSPTWEEALQEIDAWEVVDPELNARMHPPVGG